MDQFVACDEVQVMRAGSGPEWHGDAALGDGISTSQAASSLSAYVVGPVETDAVGSGVEGTGDFADSGLSHNRS